MEIIVKVDIIMVINVIIRMKLTEKIILIILIVLIAVIRFNNNSIM